jgi:hypothetical protein
MKPINRHDYGALHRQVFPGADRAASRQGWDRWCAIWQSGQEGLALHRLGEPAPAAQPDDYCIFVESGPLRFMARCPATHLKELPSMWETASKQPLIHGLNHNPRGRARSFIHNALVDGYVNSPSIGPTMAAAVAWLLSTTTAPIDLADFHLFGFVITAVPPPPDAGIARTMFNFRAVLSRSADDPDTVIHAADAAPPMPWQPPPH